MYDPNDCNKCRFFMDLYDETHERIGRCYRYPPTLDVATILTTKPEDRCAEDVNLWVYPIVSAEPGSCGEFQPLHTASVTPIC